MRLDGHLEALDVTRALDVEPLSAVIARDGLLGVGQAVVAVWAVPEHRTTVYAHRQ